MKARPDGKKLTDKLGNGEDLRALRFTGPFVKQGDSLYFPPPRNLLGVFQDDKLVDTVYLTPGALLETDAGMLRLPVNASPRAFTPTEKVKELEDYYLSAAGLMEVLRTEDVDLRHFVARKTLWEGENRLGINRTNRKTEADALYEVQHTRPKDHTCLVVRMAGLNDWTPINPLPLGGERRSAWLSELGVDPLDALKHGDDFEAKAYTVTLLSPVPLDKTTGIRGAVHQLGLPGDLVAVCAEKPVLIGGWDSVTNKPRALTPHLPAGTVFFMDAEVDASAHHLTTRLGDGWGLGLIAIGRWPS